MKKWIKALIVLVVFSLVLVGCGGADKPSDDSDNSGGGDSSVITDVPDVYEDYESSKQPGGSQFDYAGNYAAPELKIDGKGDDDAWKAITEPLAMFGKNETVSVKVYRGESALFFLFDVPDTILLTDGVTNDDAVTRSDSVEIYLDTKADGGSKPRNDDFQLDLAIHGKTRIMQGSGSNWGNWNGLIDYEVALNGTLNNGLEANDTGYSVEVMIPYNQIGIEKNDTIALAFGHVDKFGSGSSSETDYLWYGWNYGGTFRDVQTPNAFVLLDKDNVLMDRDAQEKPDAEVAGYVIDSVTGDAITGATVTATVDGSDVQKTTDDQGYFTFGKLNPELNYTVTIAKTGYIGNVETYTRAELRSSNGGRVLKTISLQNDADLKKTTVTGTVKNVVYGAVEGATVRVYGTTISAATAADGTFTIEGVPAEDDLTLVVTKTGYGETKNTYDVDDLTVSGTSALGDVNLNCPWGSTDPTNFGLKSNFFADNSATFARTLTGIEMNFTGNRRLSGHVEIYIDTAATGTDRNQDSTCWRIDLNDNGTVTGTHYTTTFSAAGLEYNLYSNDESGYSARLFIPYTYLGIQPLEVFGVSFGQWSESAKDWDGWGWSGRNTAPENPQNFIRVDALNRLYAANNNNSVVALSGNVGISGVLVKVGQTTATSGANGDWTMSYSVPSLGEAITVEYSRNGFTPATSTIAANYFASHVEWSDNVTLSEQTVSVTGAVTDSATGDPIEGVSVKATVTLSDGTTSERTATTGSDGSYTLDVTTYADVTVSFEKDGYASSSETLTVSTLSAGGGSYTLNKTLISESNIKTVTVTGTVVDIAGSVQGATVTIQSKTVTSGTDGTFSVEIDGVDATLSVAASGHIANSAEFKATSLGSSDTTYDFGDIFMPLDYVELGSKFASLEAFADFTGSVTRGADAFMFKFVGTREFTGNIEFFVDTGHSGGWDARNSTDYRFDLFADGTVSIDNYGGTNTVAPAEMKLTVSNAETTPEVLFTVPYTFLGVQRADIIGVALGQKNAAGGWDGWSYNGGNGVNASAFVDPAIPADYVRIGVNNTTFANAANVAKTVFDFADYNIHFGQTGDVIHGKVSRDSEGVTFEFATAGDFAMGEAGKELVLIYFDTGAVGAGGWDADYTIKIDSDGYVYGYNDCWFKTIDGNFKINDGNAITITRANGITTFSYKVAYSLLGIGANDVFGISLNEGWHTDVNNSAYAYNDCRIALTDKVHQITDSAFSKLFIRVAADGSLYTAESNA